MSQETIVENGIAPNDQQKLSSLRPHIDNLLNCHWLATSVVNSKIDFYAGLRRLGERVGDEFGSAGENDCTLNYAALQCSYEALQYRDTTQLNQGTGTIGDNNTFMTHFTC